MLQEIRLQWDDNPNPTEVTQAQLALHETAQKPLSLPVLESPNLRWNATWSAWKEGRQRWWWPRWHGIHFRKMMFYAGHFYLLLLLPLPILLCMWGYYRILLSLASFKSHQTMKEPLYYQGTTRPVSLACRNVPWGLGRVGRAWLLIPQLKLIESQEYYQHTTLSAFKVPSHPTNYRESCFFPCAFQMMCGSIVNQYHPTQSKNTRQLSKLHFLKFTKTEKQDTCWS